MKCPSGKTSFETEALAVEALIQNHIRNRHRSGSGPRNVYECRDCGEWHFTSRPPDHDLFQDPDTVSRIVREQRTLDWE